MHFLDAWTTAPPLALLRIALPTACVLAALAAPGAHLARWAALAVALLVPALPLGVPFALVAAWAALWLVVAVEAGRWTPRQVRVRATRIGGIESGAVGLLVGLALLVLLLAAVAQLDVDADSTRRAATGTVWVVVGLLQLMLRRHTARAALAFATAGIGIQLLATAARDALVSFDQPPALAPLLASATAVAIAARVSGARLRSTGSAWVSDAHDLRD